MIEWAVISRGFRGVVTVHKGKLGSEEEAKAWLKALAFTQARKDSEHFYATDGITVRPEMYVSWREVGDWGRQGTSPPL